jgi:DNA-binding SARP family transcriptional activator/TolB-like protein
MRVRLLGSLTIERDGDLLALPASRKVRALFAYLALAPRAVSRSQLCELLWDVPNDPRGELRWCLSKIRSFADDQGASGGRRRVQTCADAVALDLSDCFVDAGEVAAAMSSSPATLAPERQEELNGLYGGDFLEGLEIRSPPFDGWLTARRRQFRAWHAALLEQLAARAPDEEAISHLEQWLRLAPFDPCAHGLMLTALARQGRIREGEEHLESTTRLFEAEGLDVAPVRTAWRNARRHAPGVAPAGAAVAAPDVAVVAAPYVAGSDVIAFEVTAGAGSIGSFEGGTTGSEGEVAPVGARRAAIAVMPFEDQSPAKGARGGAADALAYDVISRLAKLRCMFVIAQGSVFALHERRVAPEEAGRLLKVDYVVSGSVRREGKRLAVNVNLTETASGRIVWAESFNHKPHDTLLLLDEIGNRIVASVASEVETVERNRAILKPPNSLDAWEAHHRGLWHMYRFSKLENERAQEFFKTALRLDPTFSRAYACLSFTHWQNAFQGWSAREPEADRAFEAAGQSLMADERDPAAHWAMGRAVWLRGRHDQAVVELEHAIDLSPNFALGHYTLAFVHSQTGDPVTAISSADYSRHLSPFDPLLFGMLGARAMALVRLGQFEDAAGWAVKAASRPNAHPHILAIASYSLALAGSLAEARAYAAAVHRAIPGYRVDDFLGAFRFDPEGAALFREGAGRIGMG